MASKPRKGENKTLSMNLKNPFIVLISTQYGAGLLTVGRPLRTERSEKTPAGLTGGAPHGT